MDSIRRPPLRRRPPHPQRLPLRPVATSRRWRAAASGRDATRGATRDSATGPAAAASDSTAAAPAAAARAGAPAVAAGNPDNDASRREDEQRTAAVEAATGDDATHQAAAAAAAGVAGPVPKKGGRGIAWIP